MTAVCVIYGMIIALVGFIYYMCLRDTPANRIPRWKSLPERLRDRYEEWFYKEFGRPCRRIEKLNARNAG